MHDDAVHRPSRANNARTIDLVKSITGHGGLKDGQGRAIIRMVELRDEDLIVHDHRVGVRVVRAAGVPAWGAVDGIPARHEVGDGVFGNRVWLTSGG